MGVAGLDLGGGDHRAQGQSHGLLPLVGDLPQAAQVTRLLPASTGAAARAPLLRRPAVEGEEKN